ncbi:MAG TPA: fluoride efflux transporter CrcB [bacterium]|nr:fluoride efflux transporter CrcB [bacterium]HPR87987.1 fluoride efflux transporter CrcB [bacterium]
MQNIFLIGLGGFIGTILRYILSGLVQQSIKDVSFPYGTLTVNLLGCLVIGFLSYLSENHGILPGMQRQFVFIGILGGFTTFSSFMNESARLAADSETLLTFLNIALHITFGLVAVWAGRWMAHSLWR